MLRSVRVGARGFALVVLVSCFGWVFSVDVADAAPSPHDKLRVYFNLPPGTVPLLDEAVRLKLRRTRKPIHVAHVEWAKLHRSAKSRELFVPYLVKAALNAILATRRTKAQQIFYAAFQNYFAREQRWNARQVKSAWESYKRQYYKDKRKGGKTLSSLSETGPKVSDFSPPSVMNIGEKGRVALARVLGPQIGKEHPRWGIRGADDALRWSLTGLSIASSAVGSGLLFSALGGSTFALMALKSAKLTTTIAAVLKAGLAKSFVGLVKAGGAKIAALILGGTFSTSAMAVLIVLPLLVAGVLKIVGVVKTIEFEKQLDKVINNKNNKPDLRKMINPRLVQQATLCYPRCRKGYKGNGPVCWQVCPRGYRDDGALCSVAGASFRSPTYSRGTGTPPRLSCGRRQRIAALCYNRCRPGYFARATVCWQRCPRGYNDDGLTCRRGLHIFGKKSYVRRPYSAVRTCGRKQYHAGLCYARCRRGYVARGLSCSRQCPRGFLARDTVCYRPGRTIAKKSYGRGAGRGGDCITADVRRSNQISVVTYLLKMMVADPADGKNLSNHIPTQVVIDLGLIRSAKQQKRPQPPRGGGIGQPCIGGKRCQPNAWCHPRNRRCYERCYGTATRGGNYIGRKRGYWCNYGREKPSFQPRNMQRNKIGKPCPCGVGSWCNRRNRRCYETCYSTATRGGNRIPRRGYHCNYGREKPNVAIQMSAVQSRPKRWVRYNGMAIHCSRRGCLNSGPGCNTRAIRGQCTFPRSQAQALCARHPRCKAITCNSRRRDCQARQHTQLRRIPRGYTSYIAR